jgi:serine/threonine protein kinase
MAPDIYTGKAYDPFAADVWSMGVTFFFVALGTVPWRSEIPSQMQKEITMGVLEVPAALDLQFAHVLRDMINLDPRKRPSAAVLLKAPIFAAADVKDGMIHVKTEAKETRPATAPVGRRRATTAARRPVAQKPAGACPVPRKTSEVGDLDIE